MARTIRIIYKIFRQSYYAIAVKLSKVLTSLKFIANGVEYKPDFLSRGVPFMNVNLKGKLTIGSSFKMNNGDYNTIGRQQPCYFIVKEGAELNIGNNVGISCTAIFCTTKITIGNNVRIGGNCVIYDTDFHDLDTENRISKKEDKSFIISRPVTIEENVFIGAHSTILKGVVIGKDSIIGAASVVTKSIPPNEIWAGNPARFIRNKHA